MGRAKKDGWVRKVLGIFECQVETRAIMRPGNSTTAKVRRAKGRRPSPTAASTTIRISFAIRAKREEKMRSRNLQERRLPSGRILQGPVFRAFAKPKLAVKRDVAYVARNKAKLEPMNEKSPWYNAVRMIKLKMADVGMAS